MNKLITIVLFSLTALAFGSGGVDVGNSNQKGRFLLPEFKSEPEMVEYVQGLIPKIEKGEVKEVRAIVRRGQCSEEAVKFGELSVIPSYRYNKTTGKLDKEFSGEVSVLLKNCKRPRKL